jgi:murein DD-endopeptidase MepM/ murein hydrolase activator NlpD
MRGKTVLFFTGFICGIVFIGLVQRQTTTMRAIASSAAQPKTELSNAAARCLPDRSLLDRRLIIPVEGIHVADLRNNFYEGRVGHPHEALDIMASRGTPVLAADAGRVEKLFLSKPGGLTVYQFDESRTYCYYYAHLDHYAPGLREGTFLRKGEVLGYVGSTGNASPDAPHLHFTIFKLGPEKRWWEGAPIDPYEFLIGSSGR